MLRKALKVIGIGTIGGVITLGGLFVVVTEVMPRLDGFDQATKVSLSGIGCPAGMNEDMTNGKCGATSQTLTALIYATDGVAGLDLLEDKPDPVNIRNLASQLDENPKASFKLFHIAALLGDAESQFIVGGMFSTGTGTEEDDLESLRWLHESAQSGYRKAQLRLAYMLSKGEFVAKNETDAAKWLKRAEENIKPTQPANTGV